MDANTGAHTRVPADHGHLRVAIGVVVEEAPELAAERWLSAAPLPQAFTAASIRPSHGGLA